MADPAQIEKLPLAGRDVYTMIATMPGVTADTTTARSLGISANGQRPSSSNFLLDGLESNNYLVTGPLLPVAPEAVQEYRVSTSNYSAEYGRTSGYIANAVTRAGTNQWHGTGYGYLKNTALNANDFQSNLRGTPRTPTHKRSSPASRRDPVRRDLMFVSASVDYLSSRSRILPERTYRVPTTLALSTAAPDTIAYRLLSQFPARWSQGPRCSASTRSLRRSRWIAGWHWAAAIVYSPVASTG